jgi:hypothetical protein
MFPYWNLATHLPIQKKIHDPFPPIEVNGEQKYEMDDILD